MTSTIDPNTTLCLACSASLPPNILSHPTSQHNDKPKLHITNCCNRPICPSCITSNPRLARYDPCLMCLQGVDLVGAGSSSSSRGSGNSNLNVNSNVSGQVLSPRPQARDVNLTGEMRDGDAFVVGDDEDEYSASDGEGGDDVIPSVAPPPYDVALAASEVVQDTFTGSSSAQTDPDMITTEAASHNAEQSTTHRDSARASSSTDAFDMSTLSLPPTPSELDTFETKQRKARMTPYKYYLNKSDTLQGLALRFAVDAREICNLNSLPTSTIRTTPHLLHTRAFLLLPASAKPHPSLELTKEEEEMREDEIVRARAERKLQVLTKEADWRVAKAYVAVAAVDEVEEALSGGGKLKKEDSEEGRRSGRAVGVSGLALERYLDDEEWETRERRAGRTPLDIHGVPPLPFKPDHGGISHLKSPTPSASSESNQRSPWSLFRSYR